MLLGRYAAVPARKLIVAPLLTASRSGASLQPPLLPLALATLLLAGCGGTDGGRGVEDGRDADSVPAASAGADDAAGTGADTTVGGAVQPDTGEDGSPLDPAAARLVADWRSRTPPEVLTRRGACPFECCTYREWTALEEISVQAEERGREAPLFTIPAGASFLADSGNVHITGIGLVVAADTIQNAYGEPRLLPGDTAVVLDYLGEGYWRLWHRQEVVEVEGFWGAEHPSPRGSLLGRYRSEWWVHIRYQGRDGWFQVAPGTSFRGADACG